MYYPTEIIHIASYAYRYFQSLFSEEHALRIQKDFLAHLSGQAAKFAIFWDLDRKTQEHVVFTQICLFIKDFPLGHNLIKNLSIEQKFRCIHSSGLFINYIQKQFDGTFTGLGFAHFPNPAIEAMLGDTSEQLPLGRGMDDFIRIQIFPRGVRVDLQWENTWEYTYYIASRIMDMLERPPIKSAILELIDLINPIYFDNLPHNIQPLLKGKKRYLFESSIAPSELKPVGILCLFHQMMDPNHGEFIQLITPNSPKAHLFWERIDSLLHNDLKSKLGQNAKEAYRKIHYKFKSFQYIYAELFGYQFGQPEWLRIKEIQNFPHLKNKKKGKPRISEKK